MHVARRILGMGAVGPLLVVISAAAKYSGGTGTMHDPYQIALTSDLIALGETPADCDKHFVLTADIDLDPNLPGGHVFAQAVIPRFTGVFDGDGHTISRLTVNGEAHLGLFGLLESNAQVMSLGVVDVNITGSGNYVGGLAGHNDWSSGGVTRCYSTGTVRGHEFVGGLLGRNSSGSVTCCCSACRVGGVHHVGGLVGDNYGIVIQCYGTGTVGGHKEVGGLVGFNLGSVTQCYGTGVVVGELSVGGLAGSQAGSMTECYSTSSVTGDGNDVGGLLGLLFVSGSVTHCYGTGPVNGMGDGIGGLVGTNLDGSIESSFWDKQTSGLPSSAGGTGKTTAEMQSAKTFLEAGWDFVGEETNGTTDIWWLLQGRIYPRLTWERAEPGEPRPAFAPHPLDGGTDIVRSSILHWTPGEPLLAHDIYLGHNREEVANATPETLDVYRGRYGAELTDYDPGVLEWAQDYYWRIDEVNEADPHSPWKGRVWSFTTVDFVVVSVVDDFEAYTDDQGNRIYQTWIDGLGPDPNVPGNGTGSYVGYTDPPHAEQTIVHNGEQSMPMDYGNAKEPCYSEAERTWAKPQDWTTLDADTLTLYFRGKADNGRDLLYVGIGDSAWRVAVVVHQDAEAVRAPKWQKWQIALAEVRAAGVDLAAVKKMMIGVGDRQNPKPGGTGRIYIDDICLTKRMLP